MHIDYIKLQTLCRDMYVVRHAKKSDDASGQYFDCTNRGSIFADGGKLLRIELRTPYKFQKKIEKLEALGLQFWDEGDGKLYTTFHVSLFEQVATIMRPLKNKHPMPIAPEPVEHKKIVLPKPEPIYEFGSRRCRVCRQTLWSSNPETMTHVQCNMEFIKLQLVNEINVELKAKREAAKFERDRRKALRVKKAG